MPENANVRRSLTLPLILGLLLIAALGTVAVQARAQGEPPEKLSEADLLSRVASAPQDAPAFSTTVSVEQTLVPEGLLGASKGDGNSDSGPLTARIWRGGPDKLRAELQGKNGDKVFVHNGSTVNVYDGATNTLKTGDQPDEASQTPEEKAASPDKIDELLADISPTSDLQSGDPVQIAGRWAYPLTLEPKDKDSTLVDRAEAFVDAETFVPLSFELYAKGNSDPVVSYEARDFTVGPQPDDRFQFETPPGAQVEALDSHNDGDRTKDGQKGQEPQKVASVAEAQSLVNFPVKQLASPPGGRELSGVRVFNSEGVVQSYGSGWGTVILAQKPESNDQPSDKEAGSETTGDDGRHGSQIPAVDLGGGVEAREISTPIGTALWWSTDGVSYSLKGSVPAADLEEAARGLR